MPPHFGFSEPPPSPSSDEVARLLGADLGATVDAAVAPSLLALQRHSEGVELARVRFVGLLDGRTIFAGDGARTARSWLAAQLGIAPAHATALVHDARALRHCPGTEAAWEAGRIGAAKARLLLRAHDVHPKLFAEHETGLVAAVEPLSVAQAAIAIGRWKACAKDLADHERHAPGCEGDSDACGEGCGQQPDPAQQNRLHLSAAYDGRRVGELDFDAINGAMLEAALQAWIDARWHDGTFTSDDGLQFSQRRALALIDLCCQDLRAQGESVDEPADEPTPGGAAPPNTAAANAPSPSGPAPRARSLHGEPRPSISLLIDAKTLLGCPIEDLEDLLTRRCELADGTPVALPTAQRLFCAARVQQFLTKATDHGQIETIGVTDTLRDATRQQRRALRLRDGGCVFPGCTVAFDRCQIHHLDPYELGGPTLLINLVTVCSHHHHLLHEGRWRLWRTEDHHLHLVKPDRTYVPVVGHGRTPRPDQPPGTGPQPPPPLPVHHRPNPPNTT